MRAAATPCFRYLYSCCGTIESPKPVPMKTYMLALDLKPDAALIAEYEAYHRAVWPEILESIRESGIVQMEIYRTGNRLCMLLQTSDDFTFERKARLDAANSKVQEWEALMEGYQQRLPGTAPQQKWMQMELVFSTGS